MKTPDFKRLHNLRMENDAAGIAMQEIAPRFEQMAGRHENGTAPRAVSAYQLFQTPPELAAKLVSSASIPAGSRILEPSAGLGRILDALKGCRASEITTIEIAPDCCRELYQQERVGVTILQRDFLTCTPSEIGMFDAVVMNPPFHMRSDIKHILHAVTLLRSGGTLSALCLNTSSRIQALKPLCSSWEEIPAGTFGKEGTNVPTVLLTINV